MSELDQKDRKILNALQKNARLTISELADNVDLSVSGVKKRLTKLENAGLIQQYATILDRAKMGLTLLCFVEVGLSVHDRQQVANFDATIQSFEEILECHRLTGGADYLLKIVVRDRDHLDDFLMDKLMLLSGVDKVKTSVVLKEIKETTHIPIYS